MADLLFRLKCIPGAEVSLARAMAACGLSYRFFKTCSSADLKNPHFVRAATFFQMPRSRGPCTITQCGALSLPRGLFEADFDIYRSC
jgi:hypothetical protein